MVKGVNKTIIEINNTGNAFFERAILFVDPDFSRMGEKKLHEEAVRFLGQVSEGNAGFGYLRKKTETKKKKRKILLMSVAGLIVLTALLLIFL